MRNILSAAVLTAMVSVACAGDMERTAVSGGLEGINLSGVERIAVPAPTLESKLPGADQQLSALADMFKGPGVIQMPSAGVQNGANSLKVNVGMVDCIGDTGSTSLTESKIAETIKYWNETVSGNASTLTALQVDGVHVTYEAGQNNPGVREYLIKSLVRKEDRAAVRTLLNIESFGADYTLIKTYNIDSEIIGREIVIIKPWDASKALIIELDYVAA